MEPSLPPEVPPTASTLPAAFVAELDLAATLHRLDGDERLLMSLACHVIETHATVSTTIAAALDDGNIDSAITQSHTLAGAAGNLGLLFVHSAARAVLAAIRQQQSPQRPLALLQQAMGRLTVLLPTLQALSTAPHAEATPTATPSSLSALIQALADRDFTSVDLYAACRPSLLLSAPDTLPALDRCMDLLNFKDAHALLCALPALSEQP